MDESGEALRLARARLADVVDHLRVLASDADAQNAWLHPCGWTRREPYVHDIEHSPCASISELWWSLDDMWPAWREVLAPALSTELEEGLGRLRAHFQLMNEAAFVDELEALDGSEWAEVRQLAGNLLDSPNASWARG